MDGSTYQKIHTTATNYIPDYGKNIMKSIVNDLLFMEK